MEPRLLLPEGMIDLERVIGEVLARGDAEVVPAPTVALRIAALLDGGDFSIDELVRLASCDPGVASELLAVAGALAGGEAPASLPLAISRIGDRALLGVARSAAAAAGATARGPFAALRLEAWHDAVASAMLSRELARLRGLDPESAWLCGLLHDVGRIVAFSAAERLSAGARAAADAAARCEALVERWHVSLGLSTAGRLRFPRPVKDVIARHHAERLDPARSPDLVRVVRTADAIVRILWDRREAPEDERAIEDLTEAEAELLAPCISALPSALAALERAPRARLRSGAGPAGAPRESPGSVASREGALSTLRESRGPGVRLRIAGREYAATGVAPHQVFVLGPAPLGEGALVEVELLERRGLAFHAQALLCWPDGDRFGAILVPFALGGPTFAEAEVGVPVAAEA